MKITDVEALVLSSGDIDTSRADGTQDAFLVRVHTDEGIVGVGEGDTSPYAARTIVTMPSSHSLSRGLGEMLIGEDPLRIRPLWDTMFAASYHYGRDGAGLHAMSAIDMALWDLMGQVAGLSVARLLGGETATRVEIYASEVMPDTADEVDELARRVVAEGFTALKLGWGPLGRDVGRDIELAGAARAVLGPHRKLMIDGGMAYTLASAREFCRRAEPLGLFWFEEPFEADDLSSYERLTRSVDVRIACGEAHSTAAPFARLVDAGVAILQPDLGRCGGLTIGRDIAAAVRDAPASAVVIPHCFSTDVLLAATLQFVATLPGERLIEYPVTSSKRAGTLLTTPFTPEGGELVLPDGPGLGITLDEDEVARRTVTV
ncbi:MAG TPA: mandelate racemase/muconate lactonizing enzyme family protein [Acidimicrobiales bacterium]|nr:mandelate racemase/muconate lactonizing enzyme family protein [Acidimicrobiales bacterium]